VYTVVVPTFNRQHLLSGALESLLGQETRCAYEIIVVDNNSSDGTRSLVEGLQKKAQRLRYVFERQPGLSAARNAGIAAAHGTVIAFVDDDVVAHPSWLQALADTFQTYPDAWCVGGKVTLGFQSAVPAWFDADAKILTTYLSGQDHGDDTLRLDAPVIGANLSVRRDVLGAVGVFDTDLGRSGTMLAGDEDTEFCARILQAGGAIYYCGHAVVVHLVPAARLTKRWFLERAFWEGRTQGLRQRRRGIRPPLKDEGVILVKDIAKALWCYGTGDMRRAILHDVAARKRLGLLCQTWGVRAPRPGGSA